MDNLMQAPLTIALNNAGLVAGTTTTLSTGKSIDYCVKGKAYTQAALTNSAIPTLDSTTGQAFTPLPIGYGTVFLVGLLAGALTLSQGQQFQLDVSGNFMVSSPSFPEVPDTVCPIGYIVVKSNPATALATWTPAVNNWTGVTGITATFQSLITLPNRNQVS